MPTQSGLNVCATYTEGLGFDTNSLVLPAQVQQKVLQRVQVIQMIDSCINHHHHLNTQMVNVLVFFRIKNFWSQVVLISCKV